MLNKKMDTCFLKKADTSVSAFFVMLWTEQNVGGAGMDGKIHVGMTLSRKYIGPSGQQTVYMMVQLKQPKIDLGAERLPLNVSFVLDRSGSMHGAKLTYTKKAVNFAVEHLGGEDIASVVTFDSQVDVLLPAEKVAHKDAMMQQINGIYPGGTTNLSGGLLRGAGLVRENVAEGLINRVVLLTDGLANEGVVDPGKLVEMVKGLREKQITVSTLGVGSDFQEDLLVDMAEAGGGNFYFIESPDKIPEIFHQELQGLLSVTGQNLLLGITPAANVQVTGILGYEPVWGPEVKLQLPDMYNGDVKTLLVELQVKAETVGKMPLCRVAFSYDDVAGDLAAVKVDIDVSAEVTKDPQLVESGFSLDVMKEVEIFKTAQVKEEAIKKADSGDFTVAAGLIKLQEEKLRSIFEVTGDEEVLDELERLRGVCVMMEENVYSPMMRKTMKAQSYQSRKKR